MNSACLLLLSSLCTADAVTITRLDGTMLQGELAAISPEAAVVVTSEGRQELAIKELLSIDWQRGGTSSAAPATLSSTTVASVAGSVTLVDGTHLVLSGIAVEGDTAVLSSPWLTEPLRVPRALIHQVRVGRWDESLRSSWDELVARNARDDLLVFRQENVLDYVAGVVGQIGAEQVTLLARGRELSTPRERILGVIYAGRVPSREPLVAELILTNGDRWQVSRWQRSETRWSVKLRCGLELQAPHESVALIDFGSGRLRYLSDLPYDDTASVDPNPTVPGGSVVWFVAHDSPVGLGLRGAPLKVGDREFSRGVWLHSGAVVRYRLNREYRRLQAVVGFELTDVDRMPRFNPRLTIEIEGDGNVLYSREIGWQDAPESIDLDLTGVRELTVRVVSRGEYRGILERAALANARLIK